MKKITYCSLIFIFSMAFLAQAQQRRPNNSRSDASEGKSFEQGNVVISVGLGVGNFRNTIFNYFKDVSGAEVQGLEISTILPYFIKGEYAVTDNFGLGLNIAHINSRTGDFTFQATNPATGLKETATASISLPNTSIMGRANLHFVNDEKLDVYIGLGLGVRFGGYQIRTAVEDRFETTFPKIPFIIPVGFEATLGARYFFIPNLGAYAELGGAKGILQFGLCGKF
ncbi:MAG: outer membrane beta-barrel protein [Verrucomicrobia bacterium]|nr:outer membrane beta-barrel protein [Cytophagales bacterium]